MAADVPFGLIPLDLFTDDAPFEIDVVYAQPQHPDNQFPGLYVPTARMLAHVRIVPIILAAARLADARHGWRLKINDCFRPTEAQAQMATYGFPTELVAPPGIGAHPRGMAFDVEALNAEDDLVPMGTAFDAFTDDMAHNPAARSWTDFGPPNSNGAMSAQIVQNRQWLDACIFDAAARLGEPFVGYDSEWWDYRFPAEIYNALPALSESTLPACYHVTHAPTAPDKELETAWQLARLEILDRLG